MIGNVRLLSAWLLRAEMANYEPGGVQGHQSCGVLRSSRKEEPVGMGSPLPGSRRASFDREEAAYWQNVDLFKKFICC